MFGTNVSGFLHGSSRPVRRIGPIDFQTLAGCVGSDWVMRCSKSHGPDQVGSGGVEPDPTRPDPTRPAKSNPTNEKPWISRASNRFGVSHVSFVVVTVFTFCGFTFMFLILQHSG